VDSNRVVIFPGVQTSAGPISIARLASGANSELSVNLAQAGFGLNSGVLEGGSGPIGFGVVSLDGAQLAMAVTDGDRSRTDDLTRSIEGLSAPPGAPESLSLEVLQKLLQEAEQASRSTAHPFVPAVLSLSFTRKPPELSGSGGDSFLDISLIMPTGDPVGRRVDLSRLALQGELRNLYGQLARQEPLGEQDPASPTRRLHDLLIAPVLSALEKNGITSLLIVADRGLQAVPFAALHDGRRWFGERFGFSLTPSLRLTSLAPPGRSRGRLLAVGASQFTSLAPLPLVPEELAGIPKRDGVDLYLNDQFTPKVLLGQAGDPRYDRVHVATHAEFRPGGASQARIYTGNDTLALQDFVRLRKLRGGNPLELVTLSACRTALGDSDSELGFAGLALIAGARSAIGTLWYVDDVATSAYFIQLYRYLDQGLPKADALRATREAMAQGRLRLKGDAILATDGTPLLTGLTPAQQRRVAGGMGHPYFWAGVELLGTPW
jgi:CHAT domain-containing protein